MNTTQQKDRLFYELICDLAQDINDDTQSAANETISLSARFLDTESQKLVDTFHDFCAHDETASMIQGNVNANLAVSKTNKIPPGNVNTYAEQLSAIQQGVQQVIKKDAAVRAEINVVLSAMQFSELLRQHLEGLCDSFKLLIRSNTQTPDELRTNMLEKMHTYDERKAFYNHVMHQDMPAEDEEVTQELIDQLIG